MRDATRFQKGFFCLGLHRPKNGENVGGVLRAAYCYGAAQVLIEEGRGRFLSHSSNTPSGHRHIPTTLTEDMLESTPYDTRIVAVDILPGAVALPAFQHPKRALYVFGPEDGTLGKRFSERAHYTVYVPTRSCMNLAACVNVVLYDRLAKALRDNNQRLPRHATAAA